MTMQPIICHSSTSGLRQLRRFAPLTPLNSFKTRVQCLLSAELCHQPPPRPLRLIRWIRLVFIPSKPRIQEEEEKASVPLEDTTVMCPGVRAVTLPSTTSGVSEASLCKLLSKSLTYFEIIKGRMKALSPACALTVKRDIALHLIDVAIGSSRRVLAHLGTRR
jgi:hypothetical protein